MRKGIYTSFAVGVCTLLMGCAASYKSLNTESIPYIKDNSSAANVFVEYHHNVLAEARNKKYHKREINKGIQLVALKITNNTETDLEYNRNFQLYNGQTVINVLPVNTVHSQLKQQSPLYLLYLLLSFMNVTTSSTTTTGSTINSSDVHVYPIGLVVGPAIALGNLAVASSANKKFEAEMIGHSIFNRVIKKGETAYFIIGVNSTMFQPISLKLNNSNSQAVVN